MSAKGIIKTFAVGAALGAIAGILFAPRTGKQSQKMLVAKMHMIKGMVAAKAATMKKLSADGYEKLVDQAVTLAKKQKLTVKQVRDLRKDLLMRWTDIKRQINKA
jgi:gas vesicle protein